MSRPTPREFTLKYDHDYQYQDGVPASVITTDFKSAGIGDDERVKVIEKTPHVSKCVNMHDELVEELKIAVMNCPCSIAERDSGHLAYCRAPIWLDVLAKAEAE